MPALLAALIALALITPADARWKNPPRRKAAPRTVCVSYPEPGVNQHAVTCVTRAR